MFISEMNIITSNLDRYYHAMRSRHPNILWFGDESRHEIALTFDDGPHPKDTPQVLEKLANHNIHATFFLVGKYIEQYPSLVKQIHQSGYQIGVHGYRHIPFQLGNPATLRAQLDHTRNVIAKLCDLAPESINDLRPPYGAFTSKIASTLIEWQYRLVMWNNIPPHWMQPVSWTINQVLDQTIPGSIIVLHDRHGHGAKVAQILDAIVPSLKARGYRFVTIKQMRERTS